MWTEILLCKKCGHKLEIGEYKNACQCPECKEHYQSIENELYFATANSGTSIFYTYDSNGNIKRCHFHNQPRELLDEAYQKATLARWNSNPNVLAPIVRDYYDAAKKRLQYFLTRDCIPLTSSQKDHIAKDSSMQPVLDLIQRLKAVCLPHASKIDSYLSKYESILKRIKWVRDKSEHHIMKLWTMPGRIYENKAEQPNSTNPPMDILDRNFIEQANEAVVDLFQLILEVDSQPRGQDQFDILNGYRL